MFKKKLIEAPQNYWEEKSYMMIIPKTTDENLLKNALANLSASKEIKILENNYNAPKNCIILTIEYENTTYEVGLYSEKEEKYEHIWFELLEIKGNKFKAKLTQEPYYFDDIHEGYEAWFTKEDITDWLIYTKNFCANPDNVFLLEGAEE